jgi:hypothetical protein
MTSFVPSFYLRDFTKFIIKRCIDNNHFNFTIFPIFIEFLIPFNDSKSCLTKLDINLEKGNEYKEYTNYFKLLFHYFNLLETKHNIQLETLTFFNELSTLVNFTDAHSTELTEPTPITPTPSNPASRESVIKKIKANFIKINDIDANITNANQDFIRVKDWECSDLHLFINPHADIVTTAEDNVTTDQDNVTTAEQPNNEQFFINKCIQTMNGAEFYIDTKTLTNDPPDLLFKKFIAVLCNNYPNSDSFKHAKFWVISQLFSGL